ncbi:MAG: transcriptional regulator [Notoacmeibacter sp.]|nr:transcriptional regulator [Notoacmeibacter sp.]
MGTINSAQLRAARALLRMTADDVAKAAQVGVATVRRAEISEGDSLGINPANEAAIRAALEAAGVEFIEENGGGPGVRLQKN